MTVDADDIGPWSNRQQRSFLMTTEEKQGHHRNGDQAARRPHVMCSICVRRSTTPLLGVRTDRADLIR